MIYIYTLTDPLTNMIRYVGKAVNTHKRYLKHLRDSKTKTYHSACWIQSLLKQDVKPIMDIIEETNDTNWAEREIYWIKYYRNLYDLTNITEGGGFGGVTFGFKGKKHRPESIEKLKKSRTGVSINQNDKDGNRANAVRAYCERNKRPILQYDLNDFLIQEWPSAVDAAKNLNLIHSNITKCCNQQRKKCGNYKWTFKNKQTKI